MATLLSSVSPVFASHLSSTGSTVQSVSAGEVSAKGDKAGSGRVGVANGNRSCGVDQVVSRSSSRLGKKVSVKEQYKKLSKNQLSDGSGDYSFESSCGADASVNVLTSASARSLIDVDAAASDWLLEENNTINWSVNTRSGNTTGARVAGTQMRGVIDGLLCRPGQEQSLCIGELTETEGNETGIALGYKARAIRGPRAVGYDPITNGTSEKMNSTWMSTLGELGIADGKKGQSRQITGVAAGTEETDAVNVAQLKALRQWVQDEGVTWQLSVNGEDAIKVGNGNGVNLVSEGDNLTITQIDSSNKVAFNLAENLKVSSVTVKGDGPKLDVSGIDAGNKSITNVAKGTIAQASTEAINGSQLYETNTTIAKYLGGEAAYEDGDKWTKPTYKIQDTPYNDVGSAFKGVDNKLSELFKQVQGMESAGLVQKDELNVITIGKDAEGDEISVANSSRDKRKITGLKDGALSDESTDAVTGKQLHKVDKSVKELSSTVEKFESSVSSLAGNLNESLGGGSNVLKGKQPEYNIQGKDRTGIEAAFEGVDEKLTELDGKIQGVTGEVSNALVAQEKGTNVITIGKEVEGDKISIVNKSKETRTLTGLKNGDLSEKSTDAVTGKQLYELGSSVSRYLGGGADVLKGEKPKYEIQDTPYNDVGSAFEDVDASLSSLSKQVEAVEGRFIVHQDKGTHKITIGGKTEGNEISISGSEGLRKLTDVKDGELSKDSAEVVTGAQLHDVKQNAEKLSSTVESAQQNIAKFNANITKSLGGGADVLKDIAPKYEIQGQGRTGVAGAFVGVNDTLTVLFGKVNDMEKNNLVKQEESGLITIGKDVEGDEISIANNTGRARKLTNLQDGKLSDESTDAVTGKQLHTVDESVKELDRNVESVQADVTKLDTNINASLAGKANVLQGKLPTYTIQGQSLTGIAGAFEGVDEKLTALLADVKDAASAISDSLVVQEDSKITIGAKVGGDEISIAGSEGLRKLTNLEEGDLSDKSTEAVTGAQLHKVDKSVQGLSSTVESVQKNITEFNANITKSLGGGADVLKGKQPEYKIQSQERTGIAGAFEGVDKKLTELSKKVEVAEDGTLTYNDLVAQEKDTNVITIGKEVEGDEISVFGSKAAARILSGVKDGALSEVSTEAVNGAQLYKLGSDISRYLGGDADVLKGKEPTYKIQDTPYNDIGTAFKGVDTSLSQLSDRIGNVTGIISNSLVVQDESHKITIGGKTEGGEISISGSEGLRKLTDVKDGELSKDSAEAVTGAQLHDVKQNAEKLSSTVESAQQNIAKFNANITKSLGGGADVLKDIAPKYEIQGQGRTGIADAFVGVNDTLTVLSGKVNDMEKNNLVKQEESGLITIGKDVEGDEISIANNTGGARKLTNLQDGKLSDESTDAVTGKQLHTVDESVKELDRNVESVQADVTKLDTNINASLAGKANVLQGKLPTYTIQGQSLTGIAGAFEGVDEKLTALLADVKDAASAISDSLVVQEDSKITIGAKVGGDEISIAGSEGLRKLTNLEEGDLSDKSTEAVTGAQLHKVDKSVQELSSTVESVQKNITEFNANITKSLGGGADVLSGKQPEYKIQTKPYNGVEAAFEGVDKKLTALLGKVEVAEDGALTYNDFVTQEKDTNVITIGQRVEGNEISVLNNEGKVRVLTGLKDGDLSDKSTDAVTGKQLYTTIQNVEKLSGTVQGVQGDIARFDKNLNEYLGGGADVLKGTAPTYTIQQYGYSDIGSAFEGVSKSLKKLSAKAESAQKSVQTRLKNEKLVEKDELHAITIGKDVDGEEISIVNKEKGSRVLSGVTEAELSAESEDAVTGKQLYKLGQYVEKLNSSAESVQTDIATFNKNLNAYLGGDADVLKGQQPTYKIQDTSYNDVASAFEGVGEKLADLSVKVGEATSSLESRMESEKLVKQDLVSKQITIGAETGGDEIKITNIKEDSRILSGVAEGQVAKGSKDAVSGRQLYKFGQYIEKLNSGAEGVQTDIATFNKNLSAYLGDDVDVLKDQQPTYEIQNQERTGIENAFKGVDEKLTALVADVKDVTSTINNSLVVKEGSKITIGKDVEGAKISIAGSEGLRKLTNLEDGDISEHSTQAVNGAQLHEINTTIARYFGGGAEYDGQWKEPTFMITNFGAQGKGGEQQYHNVAEAFDAVNNGMSGFNNRVQQVENEYSSSLNWDADKDAYSASHNGQPGKITNMANGNISKDSTDMVTGDQLWETNEKFGNVENKVDNFMGGIVTYDKDKQGNRINSITLVGGKDGDPVVIDNVADGKVEEGSKQAVNGGQLHDYTKEQMDLVLADANKYTDEKIGNIENIENIPKDIVIRANAYTDMQFNALSSDIEKAQKEARQATAISLAVSNLRYNDKAGKFSVAFGSGIWHGQSALAFGAGYTSENGNIRSNLSATTAGGHWGIGAGIRFALN
ncbi:Coiled stalk of trimeric autotransporter adhesin [Bartonella sp. WD12.1]|nr:Coiled stalk of trimeric autotransporter adhesin [Bartonella sp. WD12.1]